MAPEAHKRPLELPSGSLVALEVPGVGRIGGDYDGRLESLGEALETLKVPDIVKGKRVLDLGANAGHFPQLYARWGALGVTAVDGRGEFAVVYEAIGTPNVSFRVGDVREYHPDQPHDVLSALGLIYHLRDPWPILRRLYDECGARLAIVEAQVYPFDWTLVESSSNGTMALEDGDTQRRTRDTYMRDAKASGFELIGEVSGIWWTWQGITDVENTERLVTVHSTRAVWVLHVPRAGGLPWSEIPGVCDKSPLGAAS